MNPTMTLQKIREYSLCASGWKTLLESLGGNPPLDTRVSLGDIARSNSAADAFWAIPCIHWNDARDVMRDSVLAPLVARAKTATAAAAVYAAQAGDASVHAAYGAAHANAYAYAAYAAAHANTAAQAGDTAVYAAYTAAYAAYASAYAYAAYAYAADAAADTAADTADAAYAYADAAYTAEREQQRADIIAAFPPLHPASHPTPPSSV